MFETQEILYPTEHSRDEEGGENKVGKQMINVVPPEPGILLLAMEPFTEEVELSLQSDLVIFIQLKS